MRYIFRSNKFCLKNLQVETTDDDSLVTIGYVVQPDGTRFPIHNFKGKRTFENRSIHDYQKNKCAFKRFFKKHSKLNGFIDFREDNYLYFHFWDIVSEDKCSLNPTDISEKDTGRTFKFLIPWKGNRRGKSFTIPFMYRTLTATNIPIKYDFCSKNFNMNFLNFNIAYLFAFGRTKYFKNTDINPRDCYFAMGPFAGVSNLNGTPTILSQFGYTYGGSFVLGIFGLNVVSSFGLETGIQSSITRFYTGIGIGYNLISVQNK